MAATNTGAATSTTTQPVEVASVSVSTDETAAKSVHKRYEGLVMVRTKAIKGKGAWYWAHLEPILVHNSDTGLPKAVKLRCSLCEAVFSASNPSRTASEHLKRGTCPNFNSIPKPISSISPSGVVNLASPPPPPQQQLQNHRKRSSSSSSGSRSTAVVTDAPPLAIIDPSRFGIDIHQYSPAVTTGAGAGVFHQHHHHHQQQQHLVLSGGKEDLGALAMFEDSVKKLKSPKTTSSPGPILGKKQTVLALDYLADWVYECCGSVSFSSLEHPKFKAFLNQVGLPSISRRELAGERLDAKYEEAKQESEAKIRDAMFFQISSDGWKSKSYGVIGEDNLVNLSLNVPNGTSIFRKAVFTSGYVQSKYAEEVLWDTIIEICGNNVHQCVGIVADKFKAKALKSLENQHHWMVNLCCQYQGFNSLIKDFNKDLALFKNVADNCSKIANFINNKPLIRTTFHKYQLQEYGHARLLRVPYQKSDYAPVYTMVEDILSSARALQLVLLDESYKLVSIEEPTGREIEELMRNPHFWNELEAVHSLVKLIKGMVSEIETERPRVGQCIPLWEDLKAKLRDWCAKFRISEGVIDKLVEKRFKKNYHPAWAAAFILDPLYLIRDTSGKYLPPFKFLTAEQEKDVDKLITRLVSREEAHIALMELMKWRTEGLDPVYAQAVQMKQRDPITGKMRIANPQSSRLVWETYLTEFKSLGKVAVRLIFQNATSLGFKCNKSFLRWVSGQPQSRGCLDRAQKMVFIAAHSHSKLEKRDFCNDQDLELSNGGDDDVLNQVFVDASL
jgi:hypothetical protein